MTSLVAAAAALVLEPTFLDVLLVQQQQTWELEMIHIALDEAPVSEPSGEPRHALYEAPGHALVEKKKMEESRWRLQDAVLA